MSTPESTASPHWWPRVFGVVLALVGLALLIGGVRLVMLGGSWYYLIAGAATVASGAMLFQRKHQGAWLFLAVVIGTALWTIAEVGSQFWGWVPRMAPMLVLGLIAALALRSLRPEAKKLAIPAAALQAVVIAYGAVGVFTPHSEISNAKVDKIINDIPVVTDPASAGNNFTQFGRDDAGTRFGPYDQINASNVNKLEVAWTYRTGATLGFPNEDVGAPIHVDGTMYLCTPQNKVIAVDATSGQEKWVFDPQSKQTKHWQRCRGVGYYEVPEEQKRADGHCNTRIITTDKQTRLWAVDAKDGKLCEGFGDTGKGYSDLSVGMGEFKEWYYMQTSQPLVADGRAIVGGWVWDGKELNEPSGVIRAYNLQDGSLDWAWDLGNPEITKLPPEGQTYTKGTPNWWSSGAYDAKLNLIYLPLGNGTPDFWGGHRSKETDEHSSSMVALHADTGKLAWKFQTVHNDTWDYDIGTPPTLVDLPDGKGGETPALVVATKTHQLFMLDRRDGKPVAQVEERPVDTAMLDGDRTSATQPFSVGMPQLAKAKLEESDMWGATMFDQLYCRIKFKQLRNEGMFTKMTDKPSLIWPGYYGGFNWGGMALDKQRNLLIVNDMTMPQIGWLMPQEKFEEAKAIAKGKGAGVPQQKGTPYVAIRGPFNSPLDIPCHQPSWGNLTAIDLTTQTIAWQVPMGTVEDSVLKGVRASLPVPIGMPSLSGPIATAGNLIFHVGTQDYYIRAYDVLTGKEVWKDRLPVGAQATPMTYLSPKSGRQFVVTVAGGARMTADRGDYVIAYALPKK